MLYIDDKKLEITKQEIFVGKFTNNGEEGSSINITLSFINAITKEKGYINVCAGFEKEKSINYFLNKEFSGVPFANDFPFIFFEVFDTEKFLDTEIDSKITIKIKDIKDGKIETTFELDDELIRIKYDGYLDINTAKMKDTFFG